ncbi:MAG: ATP-binding cassette domain-containing protein [Acidimicrobiia bacterium]
MSGLEASITLARGQFELQMELSIDPGETVALLGPNGAGKSTAVHALAGLVALDAGRVALDGVVLDEPGADIFVAPEHRSVGVVFQDYLLFSGMSCLENIAFGLRSRGWKRDGALEQARVWADRVGLNDSGRRPSELSGGEAQRVAVARALAIEPGLLLLDEPLAALDVSTRADLRRWLREHLETFAGPRVLITHDPAEAFLLADRVCVIEAGLITQSGSADDIRLRPRTRYAADLAGANLLRGKARDGSVDVAGHTIHIADHEIAGSVLLTVHPHSISVYRERQVGSPRNTWSTGVEQIEEMGERVRFTTGVPVALTVEITREAAAELDLVPGQTVWVAVKATELGVERA